MGTLARYKLEIEYIGKNYAGSQRQKEGVRTIQSEIEKALSTLTKQNKKVIFSGRTDAGVNAKGQVLHFDQNQDEFTETLVASRFINSMNGLLPTDISVKDIVEVPQTFHAQLSAKWRWYRYSIINRTQRSAFDGLSLLERRKLSLENINCALKLIEGEHDFSAFKSLGTNTPSDVCKIFLANAQKQGDEIIIDIVGNRFLYNMVRTIAGTVLMLEKNNSDPRVIKEILDSRNRQKAGPVVSPTALTLMKVGYGEWQTMTTNKIINGDTRI